MNIELVDTELRSLLPMIGRGGDPRSHVSVIIRDLCIRLGHFEERKSEYDRNPSTIFELGNTFEDAMVVAMAERFARDQPHRYIRPGEFVVDGLHGNPDLLDVVEEEVIEIKLTWMTSRHDVEGEKFWKYWRQAEAYAHMTGFRKIRLIVCFINGDYGRDRSGPDPHGRAWLYRPTDREIANNWRMLTKHHEFLMKQGALPR